MLSRAIRTVTVAFVLVGGSVTAAPFALAQETTTTVAGSTESTVVETTVAPVADAAPTGGVAAGGGFLADDEGTNKLPIAIGVAAVLIAGGFAVKRRRKA